ncbi:hypothetical protein EJ06DRAFT_580652 [Trichodelitschia bisporula]|uniref:Uncharacterized protein n=1 Tax=Trichodelitschia bisporula TaxID=703511 RepID=A0A6G1I281_9PEZI|nr:hypothetical protein EJ06DRAFT_580652 [Trichodelitschia bisporula]
MIGTLVTALVFSLVRFTASVNGSPVHLLEDSLAKRSCNWNIGCVADGLNPRHQYSNNASCLLAWELSSSFQETLPGAPHPQSNLTDYQSIWKNVLGINTDAIKKVMEPHDGCTINQDYISIWEHIYRYRTNVFVTQLLKALRPSNGTFAMLCHTVDFPRFRLLNGHQDIYPNNYWETADLQDVVCGPRYPAQTVAFQGMYPIGGSIPASLHDEFYQAESSRFAWLTLAAYISYGSPTLMKQTCENVGDSWAPAVSGTNYSVPVFQKILCAHQDLRVSNGTISRNVLSATTSTFVTQLWSLSNSTDFSRFVCSSSDHKRLGNFNVRGLHEVSLDFAQMTLDILRRCKAANPPV